MKSLFFATKKGDYFCIFRQIKSPLRFFISYSIHFISNAGML